MNIEQIADAVSQEMLMHVAELQPELVKWNREYLRRCLSKLAEQAGDEPVVIEEPDYHYEAMGCGLEDRNITDRYEAMWHGWSCAIERMFEQIPDDTLFTEAQLIAAQQRTAEACAKLAVDFYPAPGEDVRAGISRVITVGEWREYQ